MTFRQVLSVLWQRRWIIAVVALLAVGTAFLYQTRHVPTYAAAATVRLNQEATKATNGDDSAYTSAGVDLDPALVTSRAVLTDAAKKVGDTDPAILGSAVSAASATGYLTSTVTITAEGGSPGQAQARANGVAAAYTAYLKQMTASGVQRLNAQLGHAVDLVKQSQKSVDAHPQSQLATAELASAVSNVGALNTQISAIENAGDPAMVQSLAAPGHQLGSSRETIFAVALVAGLLAGIAIALLRDQFDDRVRSEREAEELAGAPSLGELSFDRKRKKAVALGGGKPSAFSESIRALRTSIQVLTPPQRAMVVVTSPDPGEGKTVVVSNLAVSWARTGKSVILVSGDLRRPRLADHFGESASSGAGLADIAARDDSAGPGALRRRLERLLQPTEERNLRILPAGALIGDPADFLATEGVERVMDQLRELADVVLVDTPPAKILADAAILSSYADGAVVVTALGRTNRASLVETVRVLRSQGANVLGTVTNMSRRRMPKSYRAYGFTPGRNGANTPGPNGSGPSTGTGPVPVPVGPGGPRPRPVAVQSSDRVSADWYRKGDADGSPAASNG